MTPTTITVTRGRRHRFAAPSRPVPGFGGRHEGVGQVHQRQRRPRVPQGRREDGRLEADAPTTPRTRSRPRAATRSRLVGTTALFLDNMTPAEQCKDKAGQPTGLPDLAVLQTVRGRSSARRSRSRRCRTRASCPYSGTGVRTFKQSTYTQYDYYFKKYGKNALHGVFLVPKDLPSTISASTPHLRGREQLGIKNDAEFGVSALATAVRRTRRSCRRSSRTTRPTPATAPTT